jgi:hypothetical protein
MAEEEKKARFIHVTIDEPEQPEQRFTFFTDVSSESILASSTGLSGVYVPPLEYESLVKIINDKRGGTTEGALVEASFQKGEKTVRFSVIEAKSQIKVFICYAKEDLDIVSKIYERLKEAGYDAWIDKKNLVGGQEWELEIKKAINESNFFLACLSSHSINKDGYYQKELKKGMSVWELQPEGRIFLIPIRLEDCQVPEKLKGFHWVNFFEHDGMENLLKAVEKGCEQRQVPVS